jgi:hypothetical protein
VRGTLLLAFLGEQYLSGVISTLLPTYIFKRYPLKFAKHSVSLRSANK